MNSNRHDGPRSSFRRHCRVLHKSSVLTAEDFLWNAACFGVIDRVKEFLVDPVVYLNQENRSHHGYTPLHIASERGHAEVVRLLLRGLGVVVNIVSDGGDTPLLLACSHGHTQVVSELLRCPAVAAHAINFQGVSPLWAAACNGHLEVVKLLLASRRPLAFQTRYLFDGTSAEEIAETLNRQEIHTLLVEMRRDPQETTTRVSG